MDKDSSTFYKAMTTGKPVIDQVQNYVNYKGKSVSILSTTIPVFEDRELVGAFEIFKDLTTERELSEKVLMLQNELYTKGDGHKALNGTQYTISDIVGESAALLELKNKAKKVANSNSPVFVYGETGTGKELIVQAMHNLSSRRGKPFIAQNCAALPENLLESILFGTAQGSFTGAKDRPGLFELADGGTLFLDEINSMNLELQSKLLRVIQDGVIRRIGGSDTKKVNVRIIAASNMDPNMMLEQNIMEMAEIQRAVFESSNDLIWCVSGDTRKLLTYNSAARLFFERKNNEFENRTFIDVFNRKMNKDIKGVTGEVLDRFFNGDWPGNVRELENTIESAMNFTDGDYIGLPDLQYYSILRQTSAFKGKESPEIPKGLGLKDAVGEYEKSVIISAIDEAGGNRAKAARMLKIPKQTLHGKLKRLGIKSRGEERE